LFIYTVCVKSMAFDIFVVMFLFFFFMVIAIVLISFGVQHRKEEFFRRFSYGLRVEDGKLVLPEFLPVEVGTYILKCYWRSSGRSSYYSCDVESFDRESLEIREIELSKLCIDTFYIYAVARNNDLLVYAPGLRVSTGVYRDIYVLCLDSSRIPSKNIDLVAGTGNEYAKAGVYLDSQGYRVVIEHVFNVLKEKKFVYDEKTGVYRVVEEYVEKPRARSARLELCFKTTGVRGSRCITVASTDNVNKTIEGIYKFSIINKLVVFHKDLLSRTAYTIFSNTVKIQGNIGPGIVIAGYIPNWVKAKLVLDIPRGFDISTEKEL